MEKVRDQLEKAFEYLTECEKQPTFFCLEQMEKYIRRSLTFVEEERTRINMKMRLLKKNSKIT